jgi:nucleotide-binding universal stress UspA family protein
MIGAAAGDTARAMVAVVWITETTWETSVDYARRVIPRDAEVNLAHVAPSDVEDLVQEEAGGLLGRRPAEEPERAMRAIAAQESQALLERARTRLARPAKLVALRGHPERELLRVCADADLLLVARDREPRLGPKSLSHETRFIVDHCPCAVMLIWPIRPPGPPTGKLPPHIRRERRR